MALRSVDPRVKKALIAMRELGISTETVKPVLKNLLKLYNRDWTLIEADNYHTLVEAIYELEDEKLRDQKRKGKWVGNVSEPPTKKIHARLEECQNFDDEGTDSDKKLSVNGNTDFVVPVAMTHSGSFRVSSNANNYNYVSEDVTDDCLSQSCWSCCGKNFNFMFSPSGDMKISSNCNRAAVQQPGLSMDMQSILKASESKFLRSNASVRSQYSVVNLVKELCASYLKQIDGSTDHWLDSGCSGSYLGMEGCNDISNGTEKVKIPLVDDFGNEPVPEFTYIPQNTIYQNAYVHVSLARIADDDCCLSCSGNCLLSQVPCACARDTGGEYAYTKQGLLKEEFLTLYISMSLEPHKHYLFKCQDCPLERARNSCKPEPCKGHLVRKFIKECWRKCGCSMLCGNRVVQRGITRKLQVFLTKEGKGWGLRTLEDFPKGAYVCEYVGEILTNMELYERNKQSDENKRHTYPVYLDADWGSERVLKDEDALCLDATYYGNVARFINHRCHDANLLAIPVEVESPDHHYYHIAFFTKEKVSALEELTWDYGLDFDDQNHPIDAFECCCNSPFCRGTKREGSRSLVVYQG
ncbi:histone-lysine N-methyltransferase SUVR4-like isoform X1 [Apium graveolens]|uniref:histone-lysine N-methyltransferase SUVR4-like isoform X1 n=1 Tax=Apium graveolens TaxID=4045 RepID=UPI003D799C61